MCIVTHTLNRNRLNTLDGLYFIIIIMLQKCGATRNTRLGGVQTSWEAKLHTLWKHFFYTPAIITGGDPPPAHDDDHDNPAWIRFPVDGQNYVSWTDSFFTRFSLSAYVRTLVQHSVAIHAAAIRPIIIVGHSACCTPLDRVISKLEEW